MNEDLHMTPRQSVTIDAAVVAHMAHLARLRLDSDEAVRLEHDLAAIVRYVDDLRGLDTTGIEPMIHPTESETPLRADLPLSCLGTAAAMALAPESEAGSYVVPRILSIGT
ncbi:MAG: Asp-tRNA(Asn)/Glu-tRNA(Gln) amidotransferase subunit GatC [Myxococcales bacterium]|nr:Asp-tRNA(Asn)/Glu-tRNA(Gln) amidotransferase subunit GatC [Myxococcales bacterium]